MPACKVLPFLLYSPYTRCATFGASLTFNHMAKKKQQQSNIVPRSPVVVVMGHIDHGKSTLLDYIRKENTVAGEAGGITQHLSAYVVPHTTKEGEAKSITFLDTPGHEAFQKMRLRGADVADVAILIVSAEDGVKTQTLEALASIKEAGIPYIVAINKIDRPGASIERTQASLIENEIYIEGMGGDIPWSAISAKTGEGVDELLDVVVLVSDLAELSGDTEAPAEGQVLEANRDAQRGTTATLLIKNGTLKSGMFVVSGDAYAPVRIMEDWSGTNIKEAGLSMPVRIVGFSGIPVAGERFYTVASKKEAEKAIADITQTHATVAQHDESVPAIPILIKADVLGTIDAIEHEINKFESDRVRVRIIEKGVGSITNSDVQNVSATKDAMIVGFNVQVERGADELAERLGVTIKTFDIIYELAQWVAEELQKRTPKQEVEEVTGSAKILKHFSTQKNTHVLGGRVLEGTLSAGEHVRVMRRDLKIGTGVLKNLQQQKSDVQSVSGDEFGMQLDAKVAIAPGDVIEGYVTKIT